VVFIKEIHTAIKTGSSVPVVGLGDDNEQKFIKLIGSGDSVYSLITEFIISSIAEALCLPVLSKQLVLIDENTTPNVLYEEVRDMIRKSFGINLAYTYYEQSNSVSIQEVLRDLPLIHKQQLFLLDVLFRNIDRTSHNHGIIRVNNSLCISDFGVSLIIRSMMNGKEHIDSTITNQLLKEHCTYTEDITEQSIQDFFECIQKVHFHTIVHNIPEMWIRICSSLELVKAKEVLIELLMKLVSEKNALIEFLSVIYTTERIDEQEQREKKAKNRKRFEEMMGLR